jgi:hypothetical protein
LGFYTGFGDEDGKKINITEALPVPVGVDESEAPLFMFYTNEILLNGDYPARYYTFK